VTGLVFAGIWTVLLFAVLIADRDCKGIFTRKVLSRIPPRKWWTPATFVAINYRYLLISGTIFVVQEFVPNDMDDLVWWVPQILVLLDDWLFHDTDLKKKWDMVRNKIKWRMELPEPLHDQVAS